MILHRALTRVNDWREGDNRLRYVPEVDRVLGMSSEDLSRYQWSRLRKIVAYSYRNVPFYRRAFEQAGVQSESMQSWQEFQRIPVLEKASLRDSQGDLVSSAIDASTCIETATGGTTASPVPLRVDTEAWARRRAATISFYKWFGCRIGDKYAYLWGAEQDFTLARTFRQRVKNVLIDRSLYLPSSFLSDETMLSYYRRLREFGADHLQAYPTPLYIFALFLEKAGLKLKFKSINVAAEFLYDYQRQKIEEVFGNKIFNWYGARELGHIATECREHNGMHLNSHGLYIEVIRNGTPVIGEEGDLVVTDLHNIAMPLIRYRIGDLGVVSSRQCSCGSSLPLLENVSGRHVDTFKRADGTYVPGVAFTNRVISDSRAIKELQIVQKKYRHFELNIVKGEEFREADVEDLKKRICTFMHESLEFDVRYVGRIPLEKSGKTRFCKSEVA